MYEGEEVLKERRNYVEQQDEEGGDSLVQSTLQTPAAGSETQQTPLNSVAAPWQPVIPHNFLCHF